MHGELGALALAGMVLAATYLLGVGTWMYCTFFRGEYWTWGEVGQGFIWPWLWWRTELRERRRR
jgi:hypothetical protein